MGEPPFEIGADHVNVTELLLVVELLIKFVGAVGMVAA
jgi:hypothetical protein